MKIFVSDYTQRRIEELVEEACVKAYDNGMNQIDDDALGRQEIEETTREIIGVISAFPERVVEL